MRHRADVEADRLIERYQATIEELTRDRDELRRQIQRMPEDASIVDIATLVASVAELTQGWGDG